MGWAARCNPVSVAKRAGGTIAAVTVARTVQKQPELAALARHITTPDQLEAIVSQAKPKYRAGVRALLRSLAPPTARLHVREMVDTTELQAKP